MTAWQPQHGDRVLAVLPDGHEIEGEYEYGTGRPPRHVVVVTGVPRETVTVRTVKPLPVTEPTAFGARVVDGLGVRWIKDEADLWRSEDGRLSTFAHLLPVILVIDADPDWGDK